MALIPLKRVYTHLRTEVDPNDDRIVTQYYNQHTWAFDTETKTVEQSDTDLTYPDSYTPEDWNVNPAMFHTESLPGNVGKREYTHDGQGGFTFQDFYYSLIESVTVTPPSGFNETDGTATVNLIPGEGMAPFQFSRDGRRWQSSEVFTGLGGDDYTAYVRDSSTPYQADSEPFTISNGPTGAVPPAPVLLPLYFSQNPVVVEVPATEPGKKVYLEIWAESQHGEGDFRKLITLEAVGNAESIAQFRYLEVALDAWLRKQPVELPQQAAGQITRCKRNILNFYCRYVENKANGALGVFSDSGYSSVLLGGLPFEVFPDLDFFSQYLPQKKAFLTWQPDQKKVGRDQCETLYFLVLDKSLASLKAKVGTFVAGNSIPTFSYREHSLQEYGTDDFKLLAIPLNIASLQADANRFSIQLVKQNDVALSELRTFVITRETQERYFLFRNSLGCFDTLRCTGQLEQKLQVESELATREIPVGYASSFSPESVWKLTGRKSMKVSTGWVTRDTMDYLQEFFLSKVRYQQRNGKWLAIKLTTKNFIFSADSLNRPALQFEYEFMFENNLYARI